MRPFLPDYGALVEMYQIVRSNYDRGVSVDKTLLRKTAMLVQQNARTSGIAAPLASKAR